jgi:hypothetical protein
LDDEWTFFSIEWTQNPLDQEKPDPDRHRSPPPRALREGNEPAEAGNELLLWRIERVDPSTCSMEMSNGSMEASIGSMEVRNELAAGQTSR